MAAEREDKDLGYGNMSKGWVKVQKKTFTRWINHFLAERMLKIEEIDRDLGDGVQLFALLEIISSKKLGKCNMKPKIGLHKIENLNKCLNFLKEEGLKLVNCGSQDIMEGNERIILGLIWTLILRYQIQLGGDEESPKNQLLKWVNQQIKPYAPQVAQIRNFDRDWKNGDVLSALADSLRPGLIDMKGLGDALRDTENAMGKSEESFNIPRLIDATDLVAGADEHSVMTYVAQFKRWQEDEAKRSALENANAKFSYADGPGVTQGFAGRPLPFTIHSLNGFGKPVTKGGDKFEATINGPSGPVPVDIKDRGDGTYAGVYEPTQPGAYVVQITLDKKPIKDSPYNCKVKPPADPSKTYAEGPGLETASEGRPTHFTVHAFDSDGRPVVGEDIRTSVKSLDDSKGAEAGVKVEDRGDGTYLVTYQADTPGEYEINSTIVETPIRDMPRKVQVTKAPSAAHSYADGPGTRGGFRDRDCPFTIHSIDNEGKEVLKGGDTYEVKLVGPDGTTLPTTLTDNQNGTYSGSYKPSKVGRHTLTISLKNQNIKDSPYAVNIKEPADPMRSYAEGPGLANAYNDKPAHFTIFAKDKDGKPVSDEDVTVEITKAVLRAGQQTQAQAPAPAVLASPSGRERGSSMDQTLGRGRSSSYLEGPPKFCPECGQKSAAVKFCMNCGYKYPQAAGSNVPPSPVAQSSGSPFPETKREVSAIPETNTAAPKVEDIKIVDNKDGTYSVTYHAPLAGVYDITCRINNRAIKDMPKTLTVHEGADHTKTYADGPGVTGGFRNRSLPFTIHAIDKFGKPLKDGGDTFEVVLTAPNGAKRPIEVKDNGNGTYSGAYTPDQLGTWKVGIGLNGKPIKGSEYSVKVRKGADPKGSYAKGKGWRFAYDALPATFTVHARDEDGTPVPGEIVQVKITDKTTAEARAKHHSEGKLEMQESERRRRVRESAGLPPEEKSPEMTTEGADIPAEIKDNGDGTYSVVYTAPMPGEYVIAVTVTEEPLHIKESPKTITCYWSCPNKPCRPVVTKLHGEIHRLRKNLAEKEGQAPPHHHDHSGHDHVHGGHKPTSEADEELRLQFEELQRQFYAQQNELKAAKTRAEQAERASQSGQSDSPELAESRKEVENLRRELVEKEKASKHHQDQESALKAELAAQQSQNEKARAEFHAKLAELQEHSRAGASTSGDLEAARYQLSQSERNLQDATEAVKELQLKLKEEQSLREVETGNFQRQMEEMMSAAEEMQAEFESRERELLEASKQGGQGTTNTESQPVEAESQAAPEPEMEF